MSFDGINSQYAVQGEGGGQQYPAIQASVYQPRSLAESVSLCLSEDSVDLLTEQAKTLLNPQIITTDYGEGPTAMYAIGNARFIILGMPRMFSMDKTTKEIFPLERGVKLSEINRVTATRLMVAIVVGDKVLETAEGSPQIFTLKLTSTKTQLLNGDRNDPDYRSIQKLNDSLQKHFKVRNSILTHLVSVGLTVTTKKFTTSDGKQSSFGVMFEMVGGARPLPESLQAQMFRFVQADEVRELLADPFGLSRKAEQQPERELAGVGASKGASHGINDPESDDFIPF